MKDLCSQPRFGFFAGPSSDMIPEAQTRASNRCMHIEKHEPPSHRLVNAIGLRYPYHLHMLVVAVQRQAGSEISTMEPFEQFSIFRG